MDKENMEENVIDIDVIDVIDDRHPVIDFKKAKRTTESSISAEISSDVLGTGNLLNQFFKIIANIRDKSYWELDNKEIKSLNNTCPKILPPILTENSGLIACILSLLGILIKRLKLERADAETEIQPEAQAEQIGNEPQKSLTGGRSG